MPGDTTNTPIERPHLFESLDALRGIAALTIVTFHVNPLFGGRFFPHAYLSVDLFFMLSGFVLAFTYQQRLDQGLSTFVFLKWRLIRLYPLYLAGLSLGFLFFVLQSRHQHNLLTPRNVAVLLAPALFFLPLLPMTAPGQALAFPFNLPTWSLFSELIANAVHAVALRRRSTRTLLILLIVAGTVLLQAVLNKGTLDSGAFRSEVGLGIQRVIFSYLAGLLLYRLWLKTGHRMKVSFILPCLLLPALLAVPNFARCSPVLDVACAFCLFPLIVIASACSKPSPFFRPIARVLGTASYAVYVLHAPLDLYFTSAWRFLFKQWPGGMAPWPGLLFVPMVVLVAVVLDKAFDVPVRRGLRRRLGA